MAIIWSGGNWIDESEGFIAMTDRGVLHGLGVFETMLSINGELQHSQRHLRRLRDGVTRLGLRHDFDTVDVPALAREICGKNGLLSGRARLRLTVTAGEGGLYDSHPGSRAVVWLTAQAIVHEPMNLSVMTLPFARNERSALSGLKTTSYAENLMGLRWARERGAEEGIFFNHRHHLCEACTANVFVKIDGKWLTPSLDSGCLPGVMREIVLEKFSHIKEADIRQEDFLRTEEMFVTSAIRGILPVRSCDGKPLQVASIPSFENLTSDISAS